MGEVYRAHDPELGREVAIKVMLDATPEFLARFRREAQAIARLTHPNVVQVYDFGVNGSGKPYFVMELVEGTSLDKIMRERGRLPPTEAVRLARQAAEGLRVAHRARIVHRDVKPSNLIVNANGHVKIVDFGIARIQDAGQQLTNVAMLMGTPGYMAPEQAMGRTVDQRADIYALGLTLFEMLSGCPPFVADDPISLVVKNAQEPLPSETLRALGIAEPLVCLIEQMGAKEPDSRPQSCEAVISALDALVVAAEAPTVTPPVPDGARSVSATPFVDPGGSVAVPASLGRARSSRFLLAMIGVAACVLATVVVQLARKPSPAPGGVSRNSALGGYEPVAAMPTLQPDGMATPKPVGLRASPSTSQASAGGRNGGPLRISFLTFKTLAAEPDSKQLAEGVAETAPEELFAKHRDILGRVSILERTSLDGALGELDRAGDFRWDKSSVMEAGHQKGAQVVVVGGVQRSAGAYRVTTRFVRVEDGVVLDSFMVTSKRKRPFEAQDDLAKGLAEKLYRLVADWNR
jgi:TolB-like protein/predicted Ser/Thr protein kinase